MPSDAGTLGTDHQKDHDEAVQREDAVVRVVGLVEARDTEEPAVEVAGEVADAFGIDDGARGFEEFEADKQRGDPAQEEHEEDREEVHHADLFVIDSGHPVPDPWPAWWPWASGRSRRGHDHDRGRDRGLWRCHWVSMPWRNSWPVVSVLSVLQSCENRAFCGGRDCWSGYLVSAGGAAPGAGRSGGGGLGNLRVFGPPVTIERTDIGNDAVDPSIGDLPLEGGHRTAIFVSLADLRGGLIDGLADVVIPGILGRPQLGAVGELNLGAVAALHEGAARMVPSTVWQAAQPLGREVGLADLDRRLGSLDIPPTSS